jgi:GNAT superfamily N-acetyltransferase
MAQPVVVRDADASEIDALARVWYDAYRDAHDGLLPPALFRVRTLESFRQRIADGLSDFRVTGPVGAPLGLCVLKADELYQLFVAAEGRGAGVAAALIDDAEARLAARGVSVAWLACAIGNHRAARFYEKRGWRRVGVVTSRLTTPEGDFAVDVWRYEKMLMAG